MTDYTITVTDQGDVSAVADGGVATIVVSQPAPTTGGGAVDSVNGETGVVVLDAADVGAQPVDTDLTAIAALTTTAFGRALLALADAAALRTAGGLGTAAVAATGDFDAAGAAAAAQAASQPLDADLTSIAALTTTAYGRALLALADAAALRTAGGLGTAATAATGDFDAAGAAAAAQAASQPLDSDLTAIAALTTTAFGRSLLAAADAAAARTLTGAAASTHTHAESDVTNLTTDLAAKVAKSLYDANTILTADTDDTPAALTVAASRIVGRKASGGIAALTAAELKTILAYVVADISDAAPLASPALTGNPTAPTASAGDSDTSIATTAFVAAAILKQPEVLMIAVSDETTAITTGTAKVTFRMPFAMTLTAVRASLTTASSSGIPTVDINEGGTTILSTKLTIDASELTSTTAATAAVISDSSLADDAEMTLDIDVAGTGAKGLKVALIGTRT